MKYTWLVFVLLQIARGRAGVEHIEKEILDKLLDTSIYDAQVMPNATHKDDPLPVGVNMFILDVTSVNALEQEVTVQLYFRQFWKDPRLKYDNRNGQINSLRLRDVNRVWKPDLFFVSERKGKLHEIMVPNVFMRIKPDGEIIFSSRVTVRMSCSMDLRYYPLDIQTCIMPIESYGYTDENIKLQWKEKSHGSSIGISPGVNDFEFSVKEVDIGYNTVTLSTGQYTALKAKLVLRRNIGYYIIQLYVPFAILVVVSWLSFWLDQKAVALRLGLTLTILAMMCLQTASINTNAPKVSYTKALDIWTAMCLSFVFASLLEFICTNQLARREAKRLKSDHKEEKKDSKELSLEDGDVSDSKVLLKYLRKYNAPSKRVDVISRFFFPILFIMFNLIYWSIYSSISHHDPGWN